MEHKPAQTRLLKTVKHRRNAPGTSPGTVVAHPEAHPTKIRMMAYGLDEIIEQEMESVDQIKEFQNKWPVLWISVEGLKDVECLHQLGALFSLHPLMLEDIVSGHQRPKAEQYDSGLFIVARAALTLDDGIILEQISLVLGEGFVLSFQESSSNQLDPVRQRVRKKGGRIRKSRSDYLTYTLLDTIVDSFFPVLDKYNDRLDNYEDEVIQHPNRKMIDRIHGLKRDFLSLRRNVWPLRETLNTLIRERECFTDDTQLFLRDSYDHVVQIIDILDSHQERGSDLINIYLSSLSNKMNEVMKVLTMIATIFMPLGFIAGVYGMNFDREKSPFNMPELSWYLGYPFALGLMATTAILFLFYFKRKGWLSKK
ncbi:MAG: magnesium and cobalt transport protein CorA [Nitrospinae bacterium CG11_big_fil_rev_8_21_14_0_20_45_15]|nr:MAG: magnesium and cobalt transport protein CorA [Nitrospinae bacterium CG11_big_fil_rev_8_21_14_0_20_45_15]